MAAQEYFAGNAVPPVRPGQYMPAGNTMLSSQQTSYDPYPLPAPPSRVSNLQPSGNHGASGSISLQQSTSADQWIAGQDHTDNHHQQSFAGHAGTEPVPLTQMKPGYGKIPSRPLDEGHLPPRPMKARRNWSRYLQIVKILAQVCTVLFSTVMFGIMVQVLVKYYSTRNLVVAGKDAWPKNAKVWPTIMLFASALVTLLMAFVVLMFHCCAFNKARKNWKLQIARYAIHIIGWIIVSFIYRYEKSLHNVNNDLWGWSCTEEATQLQVDLGNRINFKQLCGVQVSRRSISESS